MKGKRIIIPASLQGKVVKQLHMNLTGTGKTRLLVCESIYCFKMYADIEDTVKKCPMCIEWYGYTSHTIHASTSTPNLA